MEKEDINAKLEKRLLVEPCTCSQIRKAARALTLLYDNAFKSSGLLSTQLGVMYVINMYDSIRISHLAEELGMDRTTLTRNLSILERQQLIKISIGKDHRTRLVTITDKGRNALVEAIPLWNDIQRKVKSQMGEKLWHDLMENLSQVVRIADDLVPENLK